jgi:ring-1,2-phenylacetyl-CoA epoxidase subunit PaaE
MSKDFHSLRVKEIKKETHNTVSIVLEIPEALKGVFQYESGQYLTLKKSLNGEEVRRSYSISSCQGIDNDIQVSAKMIEGGKMSTYLFKELGVNDVLEVMPPDGNFVWETDENPLVLFAAGSGITPIYSILRKALKEGSNTVHLYYGNRSKDDIIFLEQLNQLRENYPGRLMVQHFLSSEGERIDQSRVKSIVQGMDATQRSRGHFYVCGPEGMIAAVKEALQQVGIEGKQLHIEYFASPEKEKKERVEVVSGEVNDITVILDGDSHTLSLQRGEAVLDGASRIGIDPPFSCQSGVCTTCRAKLLQGEVEMENNFGLGEDEVEEGYILTCISYPKTPGVIVSWDEA